MGAPTDLNDRIAIAKGWTRSKKRLSFVKGYNGSLSTAPRFNTNWRNPEGKPARRPDFTGTLESVVGMMRELNEHQEAVYSPLRWWWGWSVSHEDYECCLRSLWRFHKVYTSPKERPIDCVSEAWLLVHEKEAADASSD